MKPDQLLALVTAILWTGGRFANWYDAMAEAQSLIQAASGTMNLKSPWWKRNRPE